MNPSIDGENEADVQPPRRRFTVDEFHRMADAGIIAHDERVELIDGEVVQMAPIGSPHNWSVIYLNRYFTRLISDDLLVAPQCAVQIGPSRQLQPDFAILRPRLNRDPELVPQPDECVLVVEVADSSASFDGTVKSGLYASAAIPEYWILDLPRSRVIVHRGPAGGRYHEVAAHRAGSRFVSTALEGQPFEVDRLLQREGD